MLTGWRFPFFDSELSTSKKSFSPKEALLSLVQLRWVLVDLLSRR